MSKTPITTYLSATGKLPVTLTNDCMFHAVLQKNKNILRGLLCSLLHLHLDDITDIEIRNPITPGESIRDKEFVLDIKLCINHNTLINLEMQVINEHNWPERSLGYQCRTYDQLHRGQDYLKTMPAIHIGLLDFQPFEDNLEFYATYKLLNTKNYHLYSDKFILHVLDLTHINLATDEDMAYEIDKWANLFKATTWEELKMIATNNESMNEVLQALYECTIDENILDQCYARSERLKKERYYQAIEEREQDLLTSIAEMEASLAEMDASLAEKDASLAEKDEVLVKQEETITAQATEIAHLKELLAMRK